jgi:hypothetical protein
MGFNKKFIGKNEIKRLEEDLMSIKGFLNSDCLIFSDNEISQKFKEYEKKYNSNRIITC